MTKVATFPSADEIAFPLPSSIRVLFFVSWLWTCSFKLFVRLDSSHLVTSLVDISDGGRDSFRERRRLSIKIQVHHSVPSPQESIVTPGFKKFVFQPVGQAG